MTRFNGDDDEMVNLFPSEEQAEALIRGEQPLDSDSAGVANLVNSMRSLGARPIGDEVADRHVAMIALEAAVSSGEALEPARPRTKPRARRRVVFSSLFSSILAKILIASMAVAAVGTGVGVVADGAVPGDTLYGLDRAMEQVGIADGGAMERVEEARSLVDVDLPEAVATAGEAAETSGDEAASDALNAAAERIEGLDQAQSGDVRIQVAGLLKLLADQIAGEGVVGEDIAEAARSIGPEPAPPVEVTPVEGQPGDVPPVDVPPVVAPPVEGEPGDVPPVEAPPVEAPPVEAPPTTVPNPTP